MNKRFLAAAAFSLAGHFAAPCPAAVSVTQASGSGTLNSQVNLLGNGKYQVNISVSPTPTMTVRVEGDAADVISQINVEQQGASSTRVHLVITGDEDDPDLLSSVEEVQRVGEGVGQVWIDLLWIGGNLGFSGQSDSRKITANSANVIRVEGHSYVDVVVTGSSTHTAEFGLYEVFGNLLADVDVQENSLKVLNVGGNIGASGTPVTIHSKDTVELIEADNIHADVSLNNGDVLDTEEPSLLEMVAREGEFSGTLAAAFVHELTVVGDLDADIDVKRLNSGHVWRIGGSFIDGREIHILGLAASGLTNGLQGIIVFNNGDDAGAWESGAMIRGFDGASNETFALEDDDYPTLAYAAAGVGGGAVGVARFDAHQEACRPGHGRRLAPTSGSEWAEPAVVRLYGPALASGATPYMVERRAIGSGTWTDVTSGFAAAADPTNGIPAGIEWEVEKSSGSGFIEGYEYRIRPNSSTQTLRCAGVASEPVYNDFDYRFTITTCPTDLNDDGVVNSTDLAFVLGSYGPCNDACPTDLDGDGAVGSGDLALVLGSFGACPGGESLGGGGGGEGGGGEPPAIIAGLGFETIEEYIEWLEGLSDEDLMEHIAALLEIING